MNAPVQLAEIARQAEWLRDLCGDDEELFADMSEAENVPLERFIARVHEQVARDGEMLVGITERQAALAERKARIAHRIDTGKAIIGKALRAGNVTKWELPEVTYSVRDGKPKLVVVDADAVPETLRRVKSEPDKTAINAAYADADSLPNWLTREPAHDIVTGRVR